MALSEEEERILSEMAKNLYADDPKLARSMRDPRGRGDMLGPAIGVFLFLGGVALLLAGVIIPMVLLGAVGFVLMLVGCWRVYLRFGPDKPSMSEPPLAKAAPSGKRKSGRSFMDTVNERWERRQQGREN